jgi:glycosyltransferase involved in cell wall biosynthesis
MKQKNHIHVVYIITKLELGGAQKVCLELFNGLRDANIATHLISGSQGILVDTIKENDHVILLNTFTREISLSSIVNEIRCLWHLTKQLRNLKKEYPTIIVHTHSTKAGIIGRWAAWFAGIQRRVHTIHGYGFHSHQSWLRWIVVYLAELVTSVITTHYICVSSADVATGMRLFPYFRKKYSLIRAAVNQQQFYIPAQVTEMDSVALDIPTTTFTFGTISCFKPQKNLFDLLNAFALVNSYNPHTRLEIIGDGIQRKAIEQWIKENNLAEKVVLHGWQSDVVHIMRSWNVFTLSSLWEGLPCAIVEARLLKLPVICYDTGGIKDIIIHEKNGLLYPQKDWRSLGRGMLMLSHNKHLYMKLRSYADNLENFKTTHMVSEHIALYNELTQHNLQP